MECAQVELNGWLSNATLNRICSHLQWDSRMVNNVLNALSLLRKSTQTCTTDMLKNFDTERFSSKIQGIFLSLLSKL